ncbi:peptidoglycan DD-metalloendopeptidase family protein [Gemmiger sp.]
MEEEKNTAAAVGWEEAPKTPPKPKRTRKPAAGTAKKKTAPKADGAEKPAAKPKRKTAAKPKKAAQPAEKTEPEKTAETVAPVTPAPVPEAPKPAEPPVPEAVQAKPAEPLKPETAPEAAPETPAQPEAPEPPKPAEPAETAPVSETAEAPETPTPADKPAEADPAALSEYAFSAQDDTPDEPAPEADKADVPAADPPPADETPDADAEDNAGDTDPEDSPEEEARAANISRTAQLFIAQIMAGLSDTPEPPAEKPAPAPAPDTDTADDAEDDEPEDTLQQKLGRGASGMLKWLLLVVLFVVIIAGGGVAWLYRSATPDMLPEIKVTFDGQEVAPNAYRWHVPVVGHIFKRTYAETLNAAPTELAEPVSGASPDVVVTPSSYATQFTVTDEAGETLYDGSVTGFRSYLFAENGTFDAKLVVKADDSTNSDTSSVTGTETWQFRFTVSIKPTVQLCTASVQQGGVAAVRVASTLGTDAPTIKTTLENTGFVKSANGWICYLPIPWNAETGDTDLTVTADGYTETLTLSVRAVSFAYKDYSSKSQFASPYIGENDIPTAVAKLLNVADEDIQWSVGGFVQPFLDTFDTPLLYGMTEYAGRAYSERSTNYGYGGRTSTNVIVKPKKSKDSMIVPASGRVLLAEDLGDNYGNTVVIEHGAGLKSIFYGLSALDVKTGDKVKQGQLLGTCGKTVVAEMRLGIVPINPLAVWRGQCDGLKNF